MPLLLLLACVSEDSRVVGYYDGVDNQSDAQMRFADDADSGTVLVACPPFQADGLVTVVGDDGMLVLEASAGADLSACEVTVPARGIVSIVVRGNGEVESDGSFDVLESVDVRGNGAVHLGDIIAEDFTAELRGNGWVSLDRLIADDASFDISGNGTTEVSGAADHATLSLCGSAEFLGADFVVVDLDAEIAGSGSAEVNVTGTASIDVSGSGSIDVYGGGVVIDLSGDGGIVIH